MPKNENNRISDKYELTYWKLNKLVAGVDEAGRGALAGPVVAAAVIIPNSGFLNYGINDSKKLIPNVREKLFETIKHYCIDFNYDSIPNTTIDEINILNSSLLAMQNAVAKLKHCPDHLLIDGNKYKCDDIPYTTIIGGDAISISIASASIVAKVVRDNWMIEIADKTYPVYNFAKHKGYATKEHYQAINKYGICPIHRRTFLRSYLTKQEVLF